MAIQWSYLLEVLTNPDRNDNMLGVPLRYDDLKKRYKKAREEYNKCQLEARKKYRRGTSDYRKAFHYCRFNYEKTKLGILADAKKRAKNDKEWLKRLEAIEQIVRQHAMRDKDVLKQFGIEVKL